MDVPAPNVRRTVAHGALSVMAILFTSSRRANHPRPVQVPGAPIPSARSNHFTTKRQIKTTRRQQVVSSYLRRDFDYTSKSPVLTLVAAFNMILKSATGTPETARSI